MSSRKIDINIASKEELSKLSGIGKSKAEAIIETRQVIHFSLQSRNTAA